MLEIRQIAESLLLCFLWFGGMSCKDGSVLFSNIARRACFLIMCHNHIFRCYLALAPHKPCLL